MSEELEARELRLDVDGLTLAARAWGDPAGRPALALHGWLDNAGTFDGLGGALAEAGLHLVALDLPGHGRSAHRASDASYHFVDAVATAAHAIDALGWRRCALIGHSMGAGISSLLAGTIPERFDAVILLEGLGPLAESADTSPERLANAIADEHTRMQRARRSTRRKRVFESRDDAVQRLVDVQGVNEDSAEILCRRGLRETDGGFEWSADPRLRRPSRLRFTEAHVLAFLGRIEAPALLVRALGGWAFDMPTMARRRQAVPNLTFVEVEGGHHVHLDAPGRVLPPMLELLSHTAAPATAANAGDDP